LPSQGDFLQRNPPAELARTLDRDFAAHGWTEPRS
jgi:hypothetical protein